MCIVAKNYIKATFWDISQQMAGKAFNIWSQKHSTHHDEAHNFQPSEKM